MLYLSLRIRKDIHLGSFILCPFFGPTLYSSNLKKINSKELIQFRTGIDVKYTICKKITLGVGFYHISNAKLTNMSAEHDVGTLSLGISW